MIDCNVEGMCNVVWIIESVKKIINVWLISKYLKFKWYMKMKLYDVVE